MINVQINIHADDQGNFTTLDQAVLSALAGSAQKSAPESKVAPEEAPKESQEPSPEEKPERKTRAPRKAAASTTRAAVLEDAPAKEVEPEPEADESESPADDGEDLLNDPVTLEKALEVAGDMLNNGKKDKVMAALKAVGARKVGQIEPEKLADFMAALEG